ncbi:hypothetical protein LUZ63_000247 [Rhynchospora breviuscula]|uniref:non-specific serine/threonine protein kinase n=1 Tax=Rhynchospora breviuscula TaxID=2022672 RepID=A0A9Q0HWP2_9POAL|nr:hypothetical protein LUZ63_000247 [Rhynchospora breviuscula]
MWSALARLGFKQRRKDEEISFVPWHSGNKGDAAAPQVSGARYFSFEELKQCTNSFSENNKIGVGSYGKVYKGCCANGVVVAVRRATKGSFRSTKEFQSEIEVLSRVHHKNIVSLIGFCADQGEQVLVYEYISMGSLRENLAGKGGMYLEWRKRLQIALDSARGLAYLHELTSPPIIHRDVKSLNIQLDENLNAKVINFGLSKLVSKKEKGHVSSEVERTLQSRVQSAVKGTMGYLDPEYLGTELSSEKSDVFSFGVVMLELITARLPFQLPYQAGTDGCTYLFEEVKRAIDEHDQKYYGLRDIIDPKIANQVTNAGLRKFVQLALQCLKDSGSDRPSMYEIMKEIDIILQYDGSE